MSGEKPNFFPDKTIRQEEWDAMREKTQGMQTTESVEETPEQRENRERLHKESEIMLRLMDARVTQKLARTAYEIIQENDPKTPITWIKENERLLMALEPSDLKTCAKTIESSREKIPSLPNIDEKTRENNLRLFEMMRDVMTDAANTKERIEEEAKRALAPYENIVAPNEELPIKTPPNPDLPLMKPKPFDDRLPERPTAFAQLSHEIRWEKVKLQEQKVEVAKEQARLAENPELANDQDFQDKLGALRGALDATARLLATDEAKRYDIFRKEFPKSEPETDELMEMLGKSGSQSAEPPETGQFFEDETGAVPPPKKVG